MKNILFIFVISLFVFGFGSFASVSAQDEKGVVKAAPTPSCPTPKKTAPKKSAPKKSTPVNNCPTCITSRLDNIANEEKNTTAAVKDNTAAVKENTEEVKKTNGLLTEIRNILQASFKNPDGTPKDFLGGIGTLVATIADRLWWVIALLIILVILSLLGRAQGWTLNGRARNIQEEIEEENRRNATHRAAQNSFFSDLRTHLGIENPNTPIVRRTPPANPPANNPQTGGGTQNNS